jgi:hypothetical protein
MANEKLTAIIEENIEGITEVWIRAVRQDARIESDAELTRNELRDHVPAMLEEICELLKTGETPDPTNTLEGRVKVFLRVSQGYTGRDLSRELSLLRTVLLDYLFMRCREAYLEADLKTYFPVSRIINLYLDEALRNAISVYSEKVE